MNQPTPEKKARSDWRLWARSDWPGFIFLSIVVVAIAAVVIVSILSSSGC